MSEKFTTEKPQEYRVYTSSGRIMILMGIDSIEITDMGHVIFKRGECVRFISQPTSWQDVAAIDGESPKTA